MPAPLAVCLSPIAWGGLWTSRHEICSELAGRGWDVVFVDPPVNAGRQLVSRLGAGRRFAAAAASAPAATVAGGPSAPGAAPAGGRVRVVAPPPYLPYGLLGGAPPLAARVIGRNARSYGRFVARAVGQLHPGRKVDLLINSFMPVLASGVQRELDPAVTVYHRSDELEQFPGWRPAYRALEEKVATEADVVVCVSDAVRRGISAVRPDAAVVPNGVACARFAPGVPADRRLAALDRPVTVMAGVFDRRVDQSLLDAAAAASSLVMVGRLDGIEVPAGATWLGHVDHAEIPGILAAADVGLVCYRPGWAGDVLKIYEYLAAGLPVVTSHPPVAPGVEAAVAVVGDPEGFAERIRVEADRRTADGDAFRRSLAEEHSWARRVDQLLDLAGVTDRGAVR